MNSTPEYRNKKEWLEHLEKRTAMADSKIGWYDTICPRCKVITARPLSVLHGENKDAWRIDGKLVILCNKCKEELRKGRNHA